jgi:glycosyltransferase involved in cell wall biosynthesis
MQISIVIPMYLFSDFEIQMLESIKSQKCENYELIIVGNSISIEDFNVIITRIKIIFNESNTLIKYLYTEKKGANYSRMLGCQNAQGEYVFFMDADDQLVHNNIFEDVSKIIEKFQPDIISSNIQRAHLEDNKLIATEISYNFINSNKLLNVRDNFNCILKNYGTNIVARFIRRDLLEGINFLDLPFYQDFNVSTKVFLKAKTFYFINEPAYFWLFRSDSISQINSMTIQKHLESFNSILDVIQFYKNNNNNTSREYYYFINYKIIEFCFQYVGRSSIFDIEEGLSRSNLLIKKEVEFNLQFLNNKRLVLLFLFIKIRPIMRLYLKYKPLSKQFYSIGN